MKHLKMLVAAAVVATALMAVTAGSASATVLCKTNTNPCTEKYPVGTAIKATVATGTVIRMVDQIGFEMDRCTRGTMNGKIVNAGSSTEAVTDQVPYFEFPFQECVVRLGNVNYSEISIQSIAGTVNGSLKWGGSNGLVLDYEPEASVVCSYQSGSGAAGGTLKGGSAPVIELSIQLTRVSGSCGASTAKLTGTYTVTTPTPIYVEPS
jgi:hypothetical protein